MKNGYLDKANKSVEPINYPAGNLLAPLTKIGNSQGIRIPKPLIKPVNNMSRNSWKENIEKVLSNHKGVEDEGVLEDLLNDNDLEDWQW